MAGIVVYCGDSWSVKMASDALVRNELNMNEKIGTIAECCLSGGEIDGRQIDALLSEAGTGFWDLLYWANKIRERFFGNKVKVCSIVPGRLGGCNQDCKFCAQSARYNAGYTSTETLSDEEVLSAA